MNTNTDGRKFPPYNIFTRKTITDLQKCNYCATNKEKREDGLHSYIKFNEWYARGDLEHYHNKSASSATVVLLKIKITLTINI